MTWPKLEQDLIRDEGLELNPYKDSVGKLTIGVGRNLSDNGISEDEAIAMLRTDIARATTDAKSLFRNFDSLSEVRQRVLVNMAFNMGRKRLSSFRKMREAVESGRYQQAATEMVDSRWYKQVGIRAVRLEYMMRTGEENAT
jgi:lysozyme